MMTQFFGYGVLSAALGAVFYANLPTHITLGRTLPTVQYLSETVLKKITTEKDVLTAPEIKARQIFDESPVLVMAIRRPGCIFCRHQAAELTGISDQLDQSGVRIIGVLHEVQGANEFKPYLKNGDLYYDAEKRFFGPKQRWMPLWMGFLRVSTYLNINNSNKKGFAGNFEGEGRLLGGIYLINKDKIVYAHLEENWGDLVDLKQILEAVKSNIV